MVFIVSKTEKESGFYIAVIVDRINLIFVMMAGFYDCCEMYCGPEHHSGFKLPEIHYIYLVIFLKYPMKNYSSGQEKHNFLPL